MLVTPCPSGMPLCRKGPATRTRGALAKAQPPTVAIACASVSRAQPPPRPILAGNVPGPHLAPVGARRLVRRIMMPRAAGEVWAKAASGESVTAAPRPIAAMVLSIQRPPKSNEQVVGNRTRRTTWPRRRRRRPSSSIRRRSDLRPRSCPRPANQHPYHFTANYRVSPRMRRQEPASSRRLRTRRLLRRRPKIADSEFAILLASAV